MPCGVSFGSFSPYCDRSILCICVGWDWRSRVICADRVVFFFFFFWGSWGVVLWDWVAVTNMLLQKNTSSCSRSARLRVTWDRRRTTSRSRHKYYIRGIEFNWGDEMAETWWACGACLSRRAVEMSLDCTDQLGYRIPAPSRANRVVGRKGISGTAGVYAELFLFPLRKGFLRRSCVPSLVLYI